MKNLEVKVKVNSLHTVKSRLSFAQHRGILHQQDTYFLLGRKRLKIRNQDNFLELIFYVRNNEKESKESYYFRFPIRKNIYPILLSLLRFIFKEKALVVKERDLFIYKHTRIHLDTVNSLGHFLELETVFSEDLSQEEYVSEHEEVKKILKFENYIPIAQSYSDLVSK